MAFGQGMQLGEGGVLLAGTITSRSGDLSILWENCAMDDTMMILYHDTMSILGENRPYVETRGDSPG